MHGEQYLTSGFSYLLIGDYQQAMSAFAKAIAADPANAAYAFHGSMTAWRNEQYDLAREWAQRAADLEPENELYQQHLNMVYAHNLFEQARTAFLEGQEPQAQELLSRALSTDPLNQHARNLQDDIDDNQGVTDA